MFWRARAPSTFLRAQRRKKCYTQIGGLVVATVITLILVPVFYSISVLDLKIVNWEVGKR